MDKKGGFSIDLNDNSRLPWGEWAESHSLSFTDCMWNCVKKRDPVGLGGSILRRGWNAVSSGINCYLCYQTGGYLRCGACLFNLFNFYKSVRDPRGNEISQCRQNCEANTDSHKCIKQMKWCQLLVPGGAFNMPREVAYVRNCSNGVYDLFPSANPCGGLRCVNGECVKLNLEQCIGYIHETRESSTQSVQTQGVQEPSSPSGGCGVSHIQVRPAHDPNAKAIDVKGDVLPGQMLTYTIEYENTGAGTAFEVFIIDQLDSDLDESTLVINNGGTYSPGARLLSWQIGTLAPGQQGSVSFNVKVKNGLPSGTEIINYAEVHFPSAMEITPTNPVVNIVRTLAADPKTVETTSGTPLPISLSGRDSGSNPLTYRVTIKPVYGDLAGTPPNVTYTSMDEFSGQDEFYYVVNNGVIDSDPARVIIKVNPNPLDTSPPEVINTYPQAGSSNVHISRNPISTTPDLYMPIIEATFSEPIDAATVTSSTFIVQGLQGTVHYDERLRTAYFTPSVPLEYLTTYTATLTTGIKDKMGNSMNSDFSWQFTTESAQNIAVILPDQEEWVQFPSQLVNSTSANKIINVTNTGTMDLSIGTITILEGIPAQFLISQDHCSGATLRQNENCIVRVAFRPLSPGAKNATISTPSNDPDTPEFRIAMTGVGVVLQHTLTITKTGVGVGTVTATGCPLNWSGNIGTCTVGDGTSITLSGIANTGSVFAGWSSGTGSASWCTGPGNCTFNLTANSSITATFNPQANFIALVSPLEGSGFTACSYYSLPKFQWSTDQVFKSVEVQFSLQNDFATVLKAKANPSLKELQITSSVWKKVLLLPGASGGIIYWRVVGKKADKTVVVSHLRSFRVKAPEEVGDPVIFPISITGLPTLTWGSNCAVKFKVWFGNDSDFMKVGMKKKALSFSISNPNDNGGVFQSS